MKEQDLSQVFYDLQTAKNVLQHLSDEALFDSCAMDIQVHGRTDLDRFYEKLVEGQKLTRDERKELEAFYILTSIDFLVNE